MGSKVEILSRDAHRVAIVDIMRLFLGQTRDPELLRRATKVSALPGNWKAELLLRARSDVGGSDSWLAFTATEKLMLLERR